MGICLLRGCGLILARQENIPILLDRMKEKEKRIGVDINILFRKRKERNKIRISF